MNEVINKEMDIENMIYEVRGVEVMLDSDLARLFNYETKNLNRQVQRNINRFPRNFCFQLTNEEYNYLRCQNVTSSLNTKYGGRRYLPYVFTEHGITMLAGILKSDIAVEMSIRIVNTFIEIKKYISNSVLEQQYYKNILLDILSKANKEIIIIDNYAGKELLDILKDINKNIVIVSKNIKEELINKYKSQYNNISFIYNNSFHDRFIIIDKTILYHSGSSFKDLGKKCFAINLIDDKSILNEIITKIEEYYDK